LDYRNQETPAEDDNNARKSRYGSSQQTKWGALLHLAPISHIIYWDHHYNELHRQTMALFCSNMNWLTRN